MFETHLCYNIKYGLIDNYIQKIMNDLIKVLSLCYWTDKKITQEEFDSSDIIDEICSEDEKGK